MKRIFTIFGILFVLILAGIITFYVLIGKAVVTGYQEYDGNEQSLKEIVGEEVVLKGDTLLIMDYSALNNTVTLEDDREINGDLAKKITIKNK